MAEHRPSHAFLDAASHLADRTYGLSSSGDHQYILRDLLTDCRHYADLYGVNFHQALDNSYLVYLEECSSPEAPAEGESEPTATTSAPQS